jgi:hypothetical protein
MRIERRPKGLYAAACALLLFGQAGNLGVATATSDQYDPRRDPNYIREASATTPINWEAVWTQVREFEARTSINLQSARALPYYPQPQPWPYVQGTPPSVASPLTPEASSYGSWYGGPLYAYAMPYGTWWDSSPRIPWWSLIPTKHHDRRGHHHRKQSPRHDGLSGHHRQR